MDNKRISKKREVKAAIEIGGKAHLNSGAMWFGKSDFSNDVWQIEDKFTHENKYSIQFSIIKKIEKEALKLNKLPALRFGFHGTNRNYILVEKKHLTDIPKTVAFETIKNSIMFKLEDLIKLANNNIMCEITFKKFDRIYTMMTWEYFIEIHKEI